jgi:kinesin family protein C2/C3
MMFVHISPESSSFQESVSSLKFGARVSDITLGQAKRNVESVSALEAKETNVRHICGPRLHALLRIKHHLAVAARRFRVPLKQLETEDSP